MFRFPVPPKKNTKFDTNPTPRRVIIIAVLVTIAVAFWWAGLYSPVPAEQYPEKWQATLAKAQRGDNPSRYSIGTVHQYGYDMPINLPEALYWYELAGQRGHKNARLKLAGILLKGGDGVDRDVERAMELLEPFQSEDGTKLLMADYHLEQGAYAKAAELYHGLAEKGSAISMLALGELYIQGRGVEQNTALGIEWITDAATQYFAPARYALGKIHSEGKIVPQDLKLATVFFIQAADLGYVPAMFLVAKNFAEGIGVPRKDLSRSQVYLRKGCQRIPDDPACSSLKK